jgi:hypothetical protein
MSTTVTAPASAASPAPLIHLPDIRVRVVWRVELDDLSDDQRARMMREALPHWRDLLRRVLASRTTVHTSRLVAALRPVFPHERATAHALLPTLRRLSPEDAILLEGAAPLFDRAAADVKLNVLCLFGATARDIEQALAPTADATAPATPVPAPGDRDGTAPR